MRIRQKLFLFPGIAVPAVTLLIGSMYLSAARNRQSLENAMQAMQIERQYEHVLPELLRGFQDAVTAADAAALAPLEKVEIDKALKDGLDSPVLDRPSIERLSAAFLAYYPLAMSVSRTMIQNEDALNDAAIMARAQEMQRALTQLNSSINDASDINSKRISGEFAAVTKSNIDSVRLILFLGIPVVLLFVFVSVSLARSIGGALLAVQQGFARMMVGDFSTTVTVSSKDELGELARGINSMGDYLRDMAVVASRIAAGDLQAKVNTRSENDSFGKTLEKMIETLRGIVTQVREAVLQINSAAVEMMASSEQHSKGAAEQASAVEEALRTIRQLIDANGQISATSQSVFGNAERTQTNNDLVAERIGKLITHTERITEILVVIKDIANKSELLALNAGLEGIKAGEAGKGFSLVAQEMQRLAESVMSAVDNIKSLTADVRASSSAAVMATEEGTKLARDTTGSAERIGLIIRQQQLSMENVSTAISDVARVAREIASGAAQSLEALRGLRAHAERQSGLIAHFKLQRGANDE